MCACIYIFLMKYMLTFYLLLFADLNIFAPLDEVCSGDSTISYCSRDGDVLQWSYDRMRIVALSDRRDTSGIILVGGIYFTVTLIFVNSTLTTSNISFTATSAADGKVLSCIGGTAASTATIRVVTDGKLLRNMQLQFWTKQKSKGHTYHLN